ncbi:MAG: hypothetical protein QXS81_03360 [Candidatus Micrarchaeaceae archaeon]
MPKRTKNRPKNKTLKTYKQNERYIKGLLLESVLQRLIEKSGFHKDRYFKQYNFNFTKIHGRGALHQIDVSGIFKLGVPFVNPILLIGEAKNFYYKVRLQQVRSFLGAYVDIMQFNRVRTKEGWSVRYKDIMQPKVTYAPVFFSLKGFTLDAQALMYAHNINYLSYENSRVMEKILKLTNRVLKQIKFTKIITDDFVHFHALDALKTLRFEVKKADYDRVVDKLITYTNSIKSYMGTLDRNYPIHVLSEKIRTPKGRHEIRLVYDTNSRFTIKSLKNREYGEFSLPKNFVYHYVEDANKHNKNDLIFAQLDLILPSEDNGISVVHLKVEENSKKKIIQQIIGTNSEAIV